MVFTPQEIETITCGKMIQGCGTKKVKGIAINSKIVKKGDLFVAIKGERLDGHRFVDEAVRRGAVAVLVSKKIVCSNKDVLIIRVKNTIDALGQLARAHRDKFSIPVIAITGSAGKTTTKELLAAVLKSRFNVLKNIGTQNNHIGVPMTLLKLKSAHDLVVMEMGTNQFGDIPWLTSIAYPTVAIFTNIGESHLAQLKTPRDVFKEKSALVKGMKKGGAVIINIDDPFLKQLTKRYKRQEFITYGIDNPCDYRASSIQFKGRHALRFNVKRSHPMALGSPAVANIYNALAAISCGRLFNISYNNINKNINKKNIIRGRQNILKVGGYWLIDDTYNSNPVSARSALQTLCHLKGRGRSVFVCADMLELGQRSKELHAAVGQFALKSGVDLVLTLGRCSREIMRIVKKEGLGPEAYHFQDRTQLHKKLMEYCRPSDVILVKGSRGTHMEQTVDFLKKNLK